MAKSYADFEKLIASVYGQKPPQKAVQYWQARMINDNLPWSEVGGKIAWHQRRGDSVNDFGTKFTTPSINQESFKKESISEYAPVSIRGTEPFHRSSGRGANMLGRETVSILKTDTTRPNKAVESFRPPRSGTNSPMNQNRSTPVGGNFEFGNTSIRNLLLPFVVVVGIVLVLVLGKKKKRKR